MTEIVFIYIFATVVDSIVAFLERMFVIGTTANSSICTVLHRSFGRMLEKYLNSSAQFMFGLTFLHHNCENGDRREYLFRKLTFCSTNID